MVRTEDIGILEAHRQIQQAAHGARAELKAQLARMLGMSIKTLDRRRMELAGRTRRPRADKGRRSKPNFTEHVETVFALKKKLQAIEDTRSLSTADAIRIAERDGLIPVGALEAHEADRAAVKLGITKAVRVVRMDCDRANKVALTDGSGSEYFYPIEEYGDGDWLIGTLSTKENEQKNRRIKIVDSRQHTVDSEQTKDKDEKSRRMLYYYGFLDMHSRLFFADIVITAGENCEDHARACEAAWRPKSDHPMAGVPEKVFTDNGPLGASEMGQSLLASLGIELVTHMPYKARAKGAIERCWRTVWQRFELPFLLDKGRTYRLSEIRAMFTAYLAEFNAKTSPGAYAAGRSRSEMYRESMAAQEPRLLPADLRLTDLMMRSAFKVVDKSCRIRWDNVYYEIIGTPAAMIGEKVLCRRSHSGEVEVRDPQTYLWLPTKDYKPVEFGDFRAFKGNINDRLAARGAELPAPSMMLHESAEGLTAADGVIDLRRAREIRVAGDGCGVTGVGYSSVDEAIAWIADEIGMPVWKLGAETEAAVRAAVAEHLDDRAMISEMARGINERLNGAVTSRQGKT